MESLSRSLLILYLLGHQFGGPHRFTDFSLLNAVETLADSMGHELPIFGFDNLPHRVTSAMKTLKTSTEIRSCQTVWGSGIPKAWVSDKTRGSSKGKGLRGLEGLQKSREREKTGWQLARSGISDVGFVSFSQILVPPLLEGLKADAKTLGETLGKVLVLAHGPGYLTQGLHPPCLHQERHSIGTEKIGRQRVLTGFMIAIQVRQGGQTLS